MLKANEKSELKNTFFVIILVIIINYDIDTILTNALVPVFFFFKSSTPNIFFWNILYILRLSRYEYGTQSKIAYLFYLNV